MRQVVLRADLVRDGMDVADPGRRYRLPRLKGRQRQRLASLHIVTLAFTQGRQVFEDAADCLQGQSVAVAIRNP